ncbi:small ubiquitin like modifier 2a isoform X1 [Hippocampus zosterae]|uniref:small ubiquitin like modifier 2a isoform X1 n=1 Tax=Hippocampus zosterae TaxID=109293 RepID=UPI00223E1A01|nr:small ubiquitin like modifier 2a isoform X1 [Hippocampus zosterae]
MADEKPKEGLKTENNEHINLKVAGQDGSVVQFKIKRHTPLNKLMKAYCERQIYSSNQSPVIDPLPHMHGNELVQPSSSHTPMQPLETCLICTGSSFMELLSTGIPLVVRACDSGIW